MECENTQTVELSAVRGDSEVEADSCPGSGFTAIGWWTVVRRDGDNWGYIKEVEEVWAALSRVEYVRKLHNFRTDKGETRGC